MTLGLHRGLDPGARGDLVLGSDHDLGLRHTKLDEVDPGLDQGSQPNRHFS